MSDRRSVENYLKFFQNLSIAYRESILSSDYPKIDPYFDYLEREAFNFSLDDLEKKLVSFIRSSKYTTKTDRILLIEDPILYGDVNPCQIIQTAFRVRFPVRIRLSQFLKKLEQQIELSLTHKETYLGASMIILATIFSLVVFWGWQKLVCQGICHLSFTFIQISMSAAIGFVLMAIFLKFFKLIGKRIILYFKQISLINRRRIKLLELRLLFTELEKMSLFPIITIELKEEFKLIVIRLEIKPDINFL